MATQYPTIKSLANAMRDVPGIWEPYGVLQDGVQGFRQVDPETEEVTAEVEITFESFMAEKEILRLASRLDTELGRTRFAKRNSTSGLEPDRKRSKWDQSKASEARPPNIFEVLSTPET